MKFLTGENNIIIILIAFLATLGCYTATTIVGISGDNVLPEVLLAVGGGLTGVAIAGRVAAPK
jgi:hypothetical protein